MEINKERLFCWVFFQYGRIRRSPVKLQPKKQQPKKIRPFFFFEQHINKLWKLIVTACYRCQNYK